MSYCRHLILFLCIFLTFVSSYGYDSSSISKTLDLGSAKPGDIYFRKVEVKNSEKHAVTINQAKCKEYPNSVMLLKPISIAPESYGAVHLKFTVPDASGSIKTKVKLININKPKYSISFEFSAIVKPQHITNFTQGNHHSDSKYSSAPIYIAFFYKTGCIECAFAEKSLDKISLSDKEIIIKKFDISQPQNVILAKKIGEARNVPENMQFVVPQIYTGKFYFIGKGFRVSKLLKLLDKPKAAMHRKPWELDSKPNTKTHQSILEEFKNFKISSIALAGFIDGLNPCAFAVLIFLLSYLQIANYKGKELFLFGTIYTVVVFMTYFLVGAGFLQSLRSLFKFIPGLTIYFFIFSGILSFLFGVLSLIDVAIVILKGPEKMILQLSKNIKEKTRNIIRKGYKKKFLAGSIIFMAFAVSLLELGCTGEIYLPVITFIVQSSSSSFLSISYLAIYNLAFIIPLIIVFILYMIGFKYQFFDRQLKSRIILIKLVLAAVFIGMAFLIFVEI